MTTRITTLIHTPTTHILRLALLSSMMMAVPVLAWPMVPKYSTHMQHQPSLFEWFAKTRDSSLMSMLPLRRGTTPF